MSRPRVGQRVGVPIGTAAEALGLSTDAVRKRIRRGTLEAYKEDDHWLVVLDAVLPGVQDVPSSPSGTRDQPGVQDEAEPIEATFITAGENDSQPSIALVPLATMVEELRGLADQLADLARRNEGLALEVGQLRERVAGHEAQLVAKDAALAAKDETIATQHNSIYEQAEALASERATVAELRRRVEAAEAERDELRRQAPSAPTDDQGVATQRAPIGDWQERPDDTRGEAARRRWLLAVEQESKAAPAPASEAPTVLVLAEPPAPPAPSGGFWARVRRAFSGG